MTSNQTPKDLVNAWVDAFNKADADLLASLYSENATNHQITQAPVIGRDAIRDMFEREFSEAQMYCIIEQVLGEGDWATLEWKDPNGLRGCGFFRFKIIKLFISADIGTSYHFCGFIIYQSRNTEYSNEILDER